MRRPIDTTDQCAFAIKCGYENQVYPKNIGKGGAHYPATSVLEIYESTNAQKTEKRRR